ncbi:HD-GYP domain-containing protein [Acididesulfobacillus acetoxydans]|nr:HD domain-containing protein [Acididesulfobacillus acetoxydans]
MDTENRGLENTSEEAFQVRRLWAFSRALDLALVDEEIGRGFLLPIGKRHGERVGYMALGLGRELGLTRKALTHVTVAGLLHDIGAVGGFRRYHGDPRLMVEHCLLGERLVGRFPAGESLAPAVRFHHEAPDPAWGALGAAAEQVPLAARILALADRVDVRLKRGVLTGREREDVIRWVQSASGSQLYPEAATAFLRLAEREAFWLDLEQPDLLQICLGVLFPGSELAAGAKLETGFTDYLALTFADLIDQKSEFTSRHSQAVAETALQLARGLGWGDEACYEMKVAGLLHDLGKLAVPRKILDKQGFLDPAEIAVIRTHTYYTYRLLSEAGFPNRLVQWAAYHHERLDGTGYPFALGAGELSAGSRLMTIADIFTALTEDRPYRKALTPGEAFELMRKGAGKSLDSDLMERAAKVLT